MGTRRTGRDQRWGSRTDSLQLYVRDYALVAHCERDFCEHSRELHIALLLRVFGGEATLGKIAARLRCAKCGMRGARIEARYRGPTSDAR